MMKRVLAMLMVVTMLCASMTAIVSASDTDPYEYYPRDMIVSGINNSGTYGVRLSWKNPNSEKLTKVTVYSVSDDTYFDETLLGNYRKSDCRRSTEY